MWFVSLFCSCPCWLYIVLTLKKWILGVATCWSCYCYRSLRFAFVVLIPVNPKSWHKASSAYRSTLSWFKHKIFHIHNNTLKTEQMGRTTRKTGSYQYSPLYVALLTLNNTTCTFSAGNDLNDCSSRRFRVCSSIPFCVWVGFLFRLCGLPLVSPWRSWWICWQFHARKRQTWVMISISK